jgi:hypothetical protein
VGHGLFRGWLGWFYFTFYQVFLEVPSRIINGFNNEECKQLFEQVIQFIDKEHSLAKLLINGLDINQIGQVMNNVDLHIKKEQPYRGKPETPLGEFWANMQNFLEKPNRAILLGLGGVYNHWTIVESISDKQIKLHDSDGLKQLNRSLCTTSDPDSQRRHRIFPTHTYFLYSANE